MRQHPGITYIDETHLVCTQCYHRTNRNAPIRPQPLAPPEPRPNFEINYLKKVIDLLWDDYFSFVAKTMNFTTVQALKYARAASDTHKAFQFLSIFRDAVMDELVYHFVDNTLGPEFTFENFDKFARESPNQSFMNAYLAVCDIVQPLFVFRGGVRANNPDYIMAGVKLGAKVFFACNSPKYRQICLHFLSQFRYLPRPVVEFLRKHQSIIRHEASLGAQGIDFILEEENKKCKQFLSPTAAETDWKMVYRNLDNLINLRTQAFADLGIADPKNFRSSRRGIITEEVEKLRILIKASDIFIYHDTGCRGFESEGLAAPVNDILRRARDNLSQLTCDFGNLSPVSSDEEILSDSESETEL